MLFDYIRLLRANVGEVIDHSYDNQDEATAIPLTLTTDQSILLGMQYPFNNFFLFLKTPNELPAQMKLEYWDGSRWTEAVDVMDGTSQGGISLSKSGHILFALDKKKTGWGKLSDPTQETHPQELEGLRIYDLYWLRISFTSDLSEETELQELGFAFTTGDKLRSIKSDIDKYMPAFKTGKTNWIPEIMTASKLLVTEMKRAGLVVGPQQVIRLDDFWLPATYKALWLIYNSLGPAHVESATAQDAKFHRTFNVNNVTVDENLNGKVDEAERDNRVYVGVR